jgi:hypothetical protein
MSRLKILASAAPLLLAGVLAGGGFVPGPRPCIAVGERAMQIAAAPWQGDLHVSFTDDPAAATVRVQIVDSAEMADFVVIDDIATADAESCGGEGRTLFVGIAGRRAAAEPVIHLSRDDGADYRIFVRSRAFTAQEAAALVVGAGRGTAAQRTAAL